MKFVGSLIAVVLLLSAGMDARTDRKEYSAFKGPYLGQKPPGLTAEVFAPGLFPPDDPPHGSPVFTPDGNEMYLPRILMMRNIDGRWTAPEPAPFSGRLRGVNPTISPDGNIGDRPTLEGLVDAKSGAGFAAQIPDDLPVTIAEII
jgi:hypothetical protein